MTPRDLLTVALRVMGLWFLFEAVRGLMQAAAFFASMAASPQPGISLAIYVANLVVGPLVSLVIGVLTLYFAPTIGLRLYPPSDPSAEEPRLQVEIVDVYRVLAFLLGVFIIMQAVQPAALALSQLAQGTVNLISVLFGFMQVGAYLICGLLLIFGSKPVAQLLSSVKYDPDRIARPQFSLAWAFVVILACSLLFGFVQYLATWP